MKCTMLLCKNTAIRYCDTCNMKLCTYHAAIHDGYEDRYISRLLLTSEMEDDNEQPIQ